MAAPRIRYNAYEGTAGLAEYPADKFLRLRFVLAYLPSRNPLDVVNTDRHEAANESAEAASQIPQRLPKGLFVPRIPHGHDDGQS